MRILLSSSLVHQHLEQCAETPQAVCRNSAEDASSLASQELQACQQDLKATSNEIQNLQQSIRSIRDFLGSDASGPLYWGCCFPEEQPEGLGIGFSEQKKSSCSRLKGCCVASTNKATFLKTNLLDMVVQGLIKTEYLKNEMVLLDLAQGQI